MKALKLRHIAGAVLLACSATAFANEYGGIYFFGDSLTDSGAFTNLTGPDANKFTNNPGSVWSQVLGGRYGFAVSPGYALNPATAQFSATGGNNYAIGGARVTSPPGVFSLAAPNEALGNAIAAGIVPVTGQITTNLGQTGGVASPNALYAVWAGANDVFYQAGVVGATGPSAIPQASDAIIAAARDEVMQIVRLRGAGAQNILVIALPDMGATPYGMANPTTTGALLTQLSAGYNSALSQILVGAGVRDIAYLDPRGLLADMMARPAAWGITNTSVPACGAISSLGCGPAQQIPGSANFLFADGVHPTSYVHRIVADWAYASLEAPGRMAALTSLPMGSIDSQWRAIDARLRHRQMAAGSGWQAFAAADYAPTRQDRTSLAPSVSGNGKSITVGVEKRWGPVSAGAAIGAADGGYSFDQGAGSIDYTQTLVSAFGALQFDAAYLDATFSVGSLDFDTRRHLGPLSTPGSTKGSQWGFKFGGGYNLSAGSLSHGPVAALLWQHTKVDSFAETGLTAMAFGEQSRDSMRHRIGWQAAWDMPMTWGRVAPYARLTHEKEYKDRQGTVTAGVAGSPFAFSVPIRNQQDGYGLLAVGATMQYARLSAHLGLSSTLGRSGGREESVSVGISMPF